MTFRGSMLLAATLLLASACSDPAETPQPGPSDATEPASTAAPPAGDGEGADLAAADASTVPAAMRGRWGRTAADCDPARLDETGLITIGADGVEYYESVARMGSVAEHAPDRLRASYTFEGEGMTWQVDMLFELDGDRLVSTQFGEEAMAQPITYTRCA